MRLQNPTQRTVDEITHGITAYFPNKYPGISDAEVDDFVYIVLNEIISAESTRHLSLPEHISIKEQSQLLKKLMKEIYSLKNQLYEAKEFIDQEMIRMPKYQVKWTKLCLSRLERVGFGEGNDTEFADELRFAEVVAAIIPRRWWAC